jgi:hypothetical protein
MVQHTLLNSVLDSNFRLSQHATTGRPRATSDTLPRNYLLMCNQSMQERLSSFLQRM